MIRLALGANLAIALLVTGCNLPLLSASDAGGTPIPVGAIDPGGPAVVTVTPTPIPVCNSNGMCINWLSADSTSIVDGSSATLNYATTNAVSVYISPFSGQFVSSYSIPIYPRATTTYTLTAFDSTGASLSQSLTVTVNANLTTLATWSPSQTASVTVPQAEYGTTTFSFATSNNKIYTVAANGGLSVCPTSGSSCSTLGATNGIGLTTSSTLGPVTVLSVAAVGSNVYVMWTQACTSTSSPGSCQTQNTYYSGLSTSTDGGSTFSVVSTATNAAVPQSVLDNLLSGVPSGPYNSGCNPLSKLENTVFSGIGDCTVLDGVDYSISFNPQTLVVFSNPQSAQGAVPVTPNDFYDITSANNQLYLLTDQGLFEGNGGPNFGFAPGWLTFLAKSPTVLSARQMAFDSNGVMYVALNTVDSSGNFHPGLTTSTDYGVTFTSAWTSTLVGNVLSLKIVSGKIYLMTTNETIAILTP